MKIGLLIFFSLVVIAMADSDDETVLIPSGYVTTGPFGGEAAGEVVIPFKMKMTEVTVSEFIDYLNAEAQSVDFTHPLISRDGVNHTCKKMVRHFPVTDVTLNQARNYCRWLSQKTKRTMRLPMEAEWEWAARGSVAGAPFSWGWGHPGRRACFDRSGPCRVGVFSANGYGLYDMSGNVLEWCLSESGGGVLKGGAWSERFPEALHVTSRTEVMPDYHDSDTGFRYVVEVLGANQSRQDSKPTSGD